MKEFIRILRTTIVGGALFLAPFVVLIIILTKAIQLLRIVTVPVAEGVPFESMNRTAFFHIDVIYNGRHISVLD